MFLVSPLFAAGAVIAGLAFGTAQAAAPPAFVPVKDPGLGSPHCPAGYDGPTNLATGCPYWMMVSQP